MARQFARDELIDRLILELTQEAHNSGYDADFRQAFAQVVLRRVDNKYLVRHRLTTLGAQLADSANWVHERLAKNEVNVRAFRPETGSNGYDLEGRIIETLMPDQPFVFDTLKLFMQRRDILVHNTLNVIVPAKQNGSGLSIQMKPSADSTNYSYTRWYCDWASDLEAATLAEEAKNALTLSRAIVSDYRPMLRAIEEQVSKFDLLSGLHGAEAERAAEVRDFLTWLTQDHFVFMGVSNYEMIDGSMQVVPERGLGSMQGEARPSGRTTDKVLAFLQGSGEAAGPLARVQKSSRDSIVHRSGKVDEIMIRTFDDARKVRGGIGVHGLFTIKALGEPGASIPMVRGKVRRILLRHEPVEGSYEHKSLLNAFNSLPVEYLFEATDTIINDLLDLELRADSTGEFQSEIVLNEDANSVYVFVALPKEHYSDDLRSGLQACIEAATGANYSDHRIHIGKFGSVALHFYCSSEVEVGTIDLETLSTELYELGTPWGHRLRQCLDEKLEERTSADHHARFRGGFPEAYVDIVHPEDAVTDIHHMVILLRDGKTRFDLLASRSNPSQALLRIYSCEELLLTKILPVVDNFGVVVAEQYAFEVREKSGETVFVNTLRLDRGEDDVLQQAGALIDGLRAVFLGRMRSDRLNRLLLAAGLTWREVDVLRACSIYSRQIGLQFQLEGMRKVLMSHCGYVSDLMEFFRLRFAPADSLDLEQRSVALQSQEAKLLATLEQVKTFEEDRILRTLLNFVQSTQRTNFYVTHDDGAHFLSFKIDSSLITEMPSPRPMFEILVHHADLDGIHLRGGKVARGGLRWSDRPDDFRSEVLGLMATQMLKNTVIVPVGAKGGFILTNPPEDYAAARADADRLYRVFIRGLLDVTDNIVDGVVVGPDNVVRHDPDDPYLVVAADKGTAHLSDTANALSQAANFWLADAFASGGSVGYDHKEKGITAKGAWVSVRQHFLEMGMDPEIDPITTVGIGDMSGDVFGNGMLLSSSMKVIAAFNHRHIFIDPQPDPVTSFAERKRLFGMGRSQWTDYRLELLSDGGGIYDRHARRIKLSAKAREALGLDEGELSGNEVVQAILKADVDLLWNGGIGTYVKASTESHQDVGDKDNDTVRVDAPEVRCRVIGEGGNLGITMRGRVEYAESGGRINLDAIDNSGGVDLSDHEVNLKTLLGVCLASGSLDPKERDAFIIEVGDASCTSVLENSRINALGISLDILRSESDLWGHQRLIMNLRESIGFLRRVERLPRGETLELRGSRGQGLFRPELGKLLAFSKMFAYEALISEPAGTLEELQPFVESYFPAEVVRRFGEELSGHMLFQEIAATVQVNHIVGRAGIEFIPAMVEALERNVSEITASYFLIEDLVGAQALRQEVEALEGRVATENLYPVLIEIDAELRRGVVALLTLRHSKASLAWKADLSGSRDLIEVFMKAPETMLPESTNETLSLRSAELVGMNVPADLARRLTLLSTAVTLPGLFSVAQKGDVGAEKLARHFLHASASTGIDSLRGKITQQSYRDDWDQLAVHSIDRSLLGCLIEIAKLSASQTEDPAHAPLLALDGPLDQTRRSIEEFSRSQVPVSACFVLNERIRTQVSTLKD